MTGCSVTWRSMMNGLRWPVINWSVELDLSSTNLPPGQRLRIGSAVIEISDIPHNGCHKFGARYGDAALRFINSARGKALRLRGVYARVVQAGRVNQGDVITKLDDRPGAA